jgi:hypothetical protein
MRHAANLGASVPEAPLNGQFHATLEPSLGLLPFWEVGAYLQGAVRADDDIVDWAGAERRSKFVTPPSFDSHWRLGVNLELSYLPPSYDRDRWGSEKPSDSPSMRHSAIRHGERSFHDASASDAHAVGLSAWQRLHALGIFIASLSAGVTKRNVWLAARAGHGVTTAVISRSRPG